MRHQHPTNYRQFQVGGTVPAQVAGDYPVPFIVSVSPHNSILAPLKHKVAVMRDVALAIAALYAPDILSSPEAQVEAYCFDPPDDYDA